MDSADVLLLSLLILLAAALYSSVGHGGASGYLAAMALFGLAPAVMRPTALCLNLLVSSLGTLRFWRAGHFRWRTFWPFAVTSIPAAWFRASSFVRFRLEQPVSTEMAATQALIAISFFNSFSLQLMKLASRRASPRAVTASRWHV